MVTVEPLCSRRRAVDRDPINSVGKRLVAAATRRFCCGSYLGCVPEVRRGARISTTFSCERAVSTEVALRHRGPDLRASTDTLLTPKRSLALRACSDRNW